MLHVRFALLIFLCTCIPALAQDDPALDQDSAPRDPETSLAEHLDPIFADYDSTRAPGCTLGVYDDGEILYARGYGMANLEYSIALGPQSVFRIASTSKQFAAAVILLLAEEGVLTLDDDIRQHLPEMPDYGEPITIRQLIHHTSGIRDYLGLSYFAGWSTHFTNQEVLDLLARQTSLNFVPGARHLYSNSGYFLLSQIVERATDKTLAEVAQQKIFKPLGMTHTHFHDDAARVVPNRADGHTLHGEGFRLDMTTLEMVGDGGIFTSVEDLFLWDNNFYANRLGNGDSTFIEQLYERGRLNDGTVIDYASGLIHGEIGGLAVIRHAGGFVGYRAEMIRVPSERMSVAVLCNRADADPRTLAQQVVRQLLAEKMTPADSASATSNQDSAAVSSPAPLAENATAILTSFTGEYWNAEEKYARLVEIEDGRLLYRGRFGASPLLPIGENRFRMLEVPADVEVRFEPAGGGQAERMVLTIDGEDSVLTRYTKIALSADELAAYAGEYYCTELDATYALSVEDGDLMAELPSRQRIALTPQLRDVFSGRQGGAASFERGGDGKISGFVLDAGRIRGLRFTVVK